MVYGLAWERTSASEMSVPLFPAVPAVSYRRCVAPSDGWRCGSPWRGGLGNVGGGGDSKLLGFRGWG
jgi:hypothetical protein